MVREWRKKFSPKEKKKPQVREKKGYWPEIEE